MKFPRALAIVGVCAAFSLPARAGTLPDLTGFWDITINTSTFCPSGIGDGWAPFSGTFRGHMTQIGTGITVTYQGLTATGTLTGGSLGGDFSIPSFAYQGSLVSGTLSQNGFWSFGAGGSVVGDATWNWTTNGVGIDCTGTFLYQAVPEPASVLLQLSALATFGVLARSRRRRRSAGGA